MASYRYMKKGSQVIRIPANEWARYRVDGWNYSTLQEYTAAKGPAAAAPKASPAPVQASAGEEPSEKPLEQMSRDKLIAKAKSLNLKVSKNAKKDEILAQIVESIASSGDDQAAATA